MLPAGGNGGGKRTWGSHRGLLAAVSNNDEISSGQQVERHGRTHSIVSSISSGVMERADLGGSSAGALRMVRQHRGTGGQVWSNWWDSVRMHDEFVLTMDTPVDRNIVFGGM